MEEDDVRQKLRYDFYYIENLSLNLDLKILPDELNKHYEVECIFRKSNKQENNKFELNKIKLGSNIFEFLFLLFKSFYQKNTRYLIVTITPYTFLGFLLIEINIES